MTQGEATGSVSVALDRVSGSPMVAYADVASWMLDRVEQGGFVRQAPFVSGG